MSFLSPETPEAPFFSVFPKPWNPTELPVWQTVTTGSISDPHRGVSTDHCCVRGNIQFVPRRLLGKGGTI